MIGPPPPGPKIGPAEVVYRCEQQLKAAATPPAKGVLLVGGEEPSTHSQRPSRAKGPAKVPPSKELVGGSP